MKKILKGTFAIILCLIVTLSFCGCDILEEVLSEFLEEEPIPSSTPSATITPTEPIPSSTPSSAPIPEGECDEMSMHFLMTGKYNGDCVYIKAGDTDILIDAGSRKGTAATITEYVNQYCEDGTLEYVIATHAHQDHIAAFVGTKSVPGIFDSYVCETIIDFPLTGATSAIYNDYIEKRDAEVESGAKHYTALQCYNETDGAKRTYTLGNGITMTILYNYYYENETSNENNYSVCLLFTQGGNNYLFTGDLEEEGEEYLVQNNDLPHCQLFKAAHHGSYTASNDVLLSKITPDIIAACCVAGSDEFTEEDGNMFPSQAFCSRASKYTDSIYVTTIFAENDDDFLPLNGNIVVSSKGGELAVNCSNNNTLLKDTDWYKAHRAA